MIKKVLITGGAGFIGSHLADNLLSNGYDVRVYDNLDPQVHGTRVEAPEYLNPEVEFIKGDVRDHESLRSALEDVDAVYHFAAAVGVGQSMYEIEHYSNVNDIGTAVLLEELVKNPVERLVVASSMSIYGEGTYRKRSGKVINGVERDVQDLQNGLWELTNGDGQVLEPVPTAETKPADPTSVYALGKYDQERMCLLIGNAYNIPTSAMRFFNVFGPRQALSNPYTGVLAIFASRLLNDKPPLIFEDGQQRRDFVHVTDVAEACRLAMETEAAAGQIFNVGSGNVYTIEEVARIIGKALDKDYLGYDITGKYRVGDIRHCFADIEKARDILGYEPKVALQEGVGEMVEWLEQEIARDMVDAASNELVKRGLAI